MGLLDELKAKDKAGLFTSNDNKVSYLTGILPLDYANGYWQQIVDEKGNKKVVPVLGVTGGSFTSLIGGTGSGKTTFADQIAFNMIKPYNDGLMFHIDAEKTAIKQRMINVTSRDMSDPRIILKTENTSIEDVLIMFDQVCEIKEAGRDQYKYEVKDMSYNGKSFVSYIPTAFIIDSLPSFNSKDFNTADLGTNMDPARASRDVSRFFNNCLDRMSKYNITFFVVNHIRPNIVTNPYAQPPKGIMMLGQNETLVRGHVSQFLSQNYFRLDMKKSAMYDKNDVGFEGFKASLQIAKSKTNFVGAVMDLVFNKDRGFDPIFTLYEYAHSIGLIQGRNPYLYLTGMETQKFKRSEFITRYKNDTEFRQGMLETLRPYLEAMIGSKEFGDDDKTAYGDLVDMEFDGISKNEALDVVA